MAVGTKMAWTAEGVLQKAGNSGKGLFNFCNGGSKDFGADGEGAAALGEIARTEGRLPCFNED